MPDKPAPPHLEFLRLSAITAGKEHRRHRRTRRLLASTNLVNPAVIESAIVRHSQPGDLVFDPACGSTGAVFIPALATERLPVAIALRRHTARLVRLRVYLMEITTPTGGTIAFPARRGNRHQGDEPHALAPALTEAVSLIVLSALPHGYRRRHRDFPPLDTRQFRSVLQSRLGACRPLLRPNGQGHLVGVTRTWRHNHEIVDGPRILRATATAMGLMVVRHEMVCTPVSRNTAQVQEVITFRTAHSPAGRHALPTQTTPKPGDPS